MARYRRKRRVRSRRKRTVRRTRRYRKKANYSGRALFSRIFKYDVADITNSATVDTIYTPTVRLTDMTNADKYYSVFESYRVQKVKITIYPKFSRVSDTVDSDRGFTYMIPDYNSVNNTTKEQAYAKRGTKIINWNTTKSAVSKTVTPQVNDYVGNNNAATKAHAWLDCTYPAVNHFTMQILNTLTPKTGLWRVNVQAWVQFKDIR